MRVWQVFLEWMDERVRHRGMLGEHRWLRDCLRKPYHWLINSGGRGVPLTLGGHIPVRVPAEFGSKLMEDYESDRLHVIWGLVVSRSEEVVSWQAAHQRSVQELSNRPELMGDPNDHEYVCLGSEGAGMVPQYTLDDLLADDISGGEAVLIKCDVEGAEYAVLRGAQRLLKESHPEILLSVHPQRLARYEVDVRQVEQVLREAGYVVEEFAIDHEHHWHCQ